MIRRLALLSVSTHLVFTVVSSEKNWIRTYQYYCTWYVIFFQFYLSINNHIVGLAHKNHIINEI